MTKIAKRVVTMVLALGIIFSLTLPVAAEQPKAVQPRMIGVSSLAAQLSISTTGRATCGAIVHNNGDYDVTVIVSLKQDGTVIKSWTVTAAVGTNLIEKYYYVTSGHDYQVVATAQIRSGGTLVRSYAVSSSVVSY